VTRPRLLAGLAVAWALAGCADPAPAPAAAPATVKPRVCPPPGTVRPEWATQEVEPPPPGLATVPCVKCGRWLLPGWRDCPRCAWPQGEVDAGDVHPAR
jgi:hypothetical protein